MALILSMYLRYENRRRDRVEGGRPTETGGLDVQRDFDKAKGECSAANSG
jgi:hypothetical protein